MRLMNIDLHIHSNHSDGKMSVKDIVEYCKSEDIGLISLTDHDSVSGIEEGLKYSSEYGIRFIPGIEISVSWKVPVHILGYEIDYNNDSIKNICKKVNIYRLMEFSKVICKLKKCGIDVDMKMLQSKNITSVKLLTKYMLKQGYGETEEEVYSKYFGRSGLAYVGKKGVSLEEAVNAIKSAGGTAILAHPGRMRVEEDLFWNYMNELMESGLDGVEVVSNYNNNIDELEDFCLKNNYLITGGSDFHSNLKERLGYVKNDKIADNLGKEIDCIFKNYGDEVIE